MSAQTFARGWKIRIHLGKTLYRYLDFINRKYFTLNLKMTTLISYRVYYEIGWPHRWFSNFQFHLLRYAKKSLPYIYFEVSITIICQLSNFLKNFHEVWWGSENCMSDEKLQLPQHLWTKTINHVNPIQDGRGQKGPTPYQFFSCNFCKRWNYHPKLSDF